MRVVYFITKSELGGAQMVVYELLRAHTERGDDVVVMANGNGWLAEKTRTLGFEYVENSYMRKTYNPWTLWRAGRTFARAVKRFHPDIVSLHSSFSGFVGRIFLRRRYPIIYTAHGWGFTAGTSWLRKIVAICAEKITARYAQFVVCVSNFDRMQALKYRVVPSKKIRVIHNGVSVAQYCTERNTTGHTEIVFVGRFAVPKRQDVLIEGFSYISGALREKSHITLIGSGPEEKYIKECIRRARIESRVTILSNLSYEESLTRVARSDIAVLLSDWEGFPMTIVEAMQLGVPVVANAVGGISEAVDDSVGRLLPRFVAKEQICKTLTELIENPSLRSTLGEHAQKRGAQYTGEIMAQCTFQLYNDVLNIYAKK